MADYRFYAFYVADKIGKTGLTVTVDAYSTAGAKVVDNQAATEVGGGVYSYTYTTATADDYLAIFKTTDTTVDAQHISSLASEEIPFIDAAISTRLASADARLDNLDATISSRAEPSDLNVTVTATVAISATEAAAVASGLLALRAYNTFSQAVTSTSEDDLSAASSVWLAIKRNTAKADADSLIFIEATDGLTVLDGAAYATPLNGSLTVSGTAGDWTVTLKVEAAAMAAIGLRVGSYDAEIKYKLGNDVKVLWAGAAILSDGVVRAIE
jgi:hypothetical protein